MVLLTKWRNLAMIACRCPGDFGLPYKASDFPPLLTLRFVCAMHHHGLRHRDLGATPVAEWEIHWTGVHEERCQQPMPSRAAL